MKSVIKAFTIFMFGVSAMPVFAQEKTKEKSEEKSEQVTIRKKGASKEKMTIVIDGDKITVNGKPVDDFNSDDLEIIRGEDMMMIHPPMATMAPRMREGGWKMMNDDFMREIRSNKAMLGVMTKETEEGAKITEVTKESAAEKAGLREGDIISKVNNDKIAGADDLYQAIGKYKPGEKVTIIFLRDGKEKTVTAELEENKQVRVFSWKNKDMDNDMFEFKMQPPMAPRYKEFDFEWDEKPRLGIEIQDTENGKGVKVLDVDEDEAAGKAGMKEDDIITGINGKTITSVDGLKEAMKNVKKGDTVKLTGTRNGKPISISVKIPKELKTTDL